MIHSQTDKFLLCGVEDPVIPNAQLYALSDEGHNLILSNYQVDNGRRYSLLFMGSKESAKLVLARVLQFVVTMPGIVGTWWVAWPSSKQDVLRGRGRLHRKWYEKNNWAVGEALDYDFATKAVEATELDWPLRQAHTGNHLSLFVGDKTIVPAHLSMAPILPSMWARHGRPAPSGRAVRWLVEHRSSVIYANADNFGRSGLVIVGSVSVPTGDLSSAVAPYALLQVTRDAASVWNKGS